jgi:hypothetical protein
LIGLINVAGVLRRYLPILWFAVIGKLVYEVSMISYSNGFDIKVG